MEFWPLKTLSKVSRVLLGLQLSPTPNMGVHLGVWGFTPSHSLHSLHSRGHVMWLSGLLLGPQPLNFLALAASQMLGLRQPLAMLENLSASSSPWKPLYFSTLISSADPFSFAHPPTVHSSYSSPQTSITAPNRLCP